MVMEDDSVKKICKPLRVMALLLAAAAGWVAMILLLPNEYGVSVEYACAATVVYLSVWGMAMAFRHRSRTENRAARLIFGIIGIVLSIACWLALVISVNEAIFIDDAGVLAVSVLYWAAWGTFLLIRRAKRRRKAETPQIEPIESAPIAEEIPNTVTPRTPATFRRRENRRRPLRRRVVMICAVCAILLYVLTAGILHQTKSTEIPYALTEFAEKYPEVADFVSDYPAHHNDHPSKDISGEVTKGVISLFIQWDERWGYEDYGGNFLGVNGCGPTCLSMVVCGLTGRTDANPYAVACYSNSMGYYTPGSGTSWALMTDGAEHYGLKAERLTISVNALTDALSQGYVIIASMKPGDFTYTGHYIVLTGLDSDGRVRVNDSNSRVNSARIWDAQVLADQMKAAWSYSFDE